MIKCLVVDDEPLALRQLVSYIEKIPYFECAASCMNGIEAREVLDGGNIDVLFVDINMPDMSGMDLVRSLSRPPMIVFTTAYSEYAIEGYKVNAIDYLLKPFSFEDFEKVAQKIRDRYAEKTVAEKSDSDNYLFFKTDYKIVRVEIPKITYVEGMSEYLKIHLEDSPQPVVALLSMKKLEENLPSYFMRIHKSYIINLGKVREVNKGRVSVSPEVYLPIGDLYKDAFNDYIDSRYLGR